MRQVISLKSIHDDINNQFPTVPSPARSIISTVPLGKDARPGLTYENYDELDSVHTLRLVRKDADLQVQSLANL